MEIIHLILGKANPDRMNGVNKVVYQLASRQADSGRPVAVWGITHDLTPNYGARSFDTRLFRAKRNTFQVDQQLKKAILAKKGAAIFHLHGGWVPTYATIARFLARHAIPFVLTPHGAYNTIARQRSAWMKKVYFRLFEKPLLDRAQRVHAIGESELAGLRQMYPNRKSFLLPYGFSAPEQLAKATAESAGLVIGFVGRLDIYTKGLDLLLGAFKILHQQEENSSLWIVGEGPGRAALEKMIADQQVSQVVLWGSKFGAEKEALMRAMHVFAHPSRNEGLPASVLEAAHLGVPCVVSRATNVGRYISQYEAGITVEDEDIPGLAQALGSLSDRHQKGSLPAMAANARRMVSEVFDWNKLLNRFDELYHCEKGG